MAIKVNNVDVIDNDRKFIPVTIQAGGTVGTAGSVLASTGTGIEWKKPSSGGEVLTLNGFFSSGL
jgi:hypothetical protein